MSSPPLFAIGQAVRVVWFSEERGRYLSDYGCIIGMAQKLPDWDVSDWLYLIEYSHIDECDWLEPGHIDWATESEIRLQAPD